LQANQSFLLPRAARGRLLLTFITLLAGTALAPAQVSPQSPYYARVNSFGFFAAYSGDSSHILMGEAENRKLLDIGASYNRQLAIGRLVNLQYSGEFLPLAMEGDPIGYEVDNQTSPTVATYAGSLDRAVLSCAPVTTPFSFIASTPSGPVTYAGTDTLFCRGRQWTMGEAISPLGLQWNFLPRHKTQAFLTAHAGYMYSTQSIPLDNAGSFNFTFDLGAGFEFYRSRTRSMRAEYRYHHISNNGTASANPGIDSGLVQVTYSFGR
jgi:opacity protein-like surface antigen